MAPSPSSSAPPVVSFDLDGVIMRGPFVTSVRPRIWEHLSRSAGLAHLATEERERLFCGTCGAIRYENPRILVALMLTCGDRLLLCRRAHQPSLGTWTPPSGFMERGETLEQAAARETFEEAGVQIDPEKLVLYSVSSLSLPTISEVYVVFRGVVEGDSCRAGAESLPIQSVLD